MAGDGRHPSDIAFTASVKAVQQRDGSRGAMRRMEAGGSWPTLITPELAAFVASQTSFFLATANASGQPYVQHRGGPPGFLRVLDERTLGFAELDGNRQFITQGNLADNPRVHLLLIDYATRRRIKVWGEARVVEDAALVASLVPAGCSPRAPRAIFIGVRAWDANCPRHIPRRYEAHEVEAALAERDTRIRTLEEELARRGAAP